MAITLPTGDDVATTKIGSDHYQHLGSAFNVDELNGPIKTSNRNPFPVDMPGTLFDAFARLRTAGILTLGDFKQVVPTHNPLIWSEKTAGGGNSIYDSNVAAQRLQVGTGATDSVARQTKRYYRYSPGKSAYILFTALFREGQNSTIKRAGYFDVDNGLFFQQTINNMEVVVRSNTSGSVVDSVFKQTTNTDAERWNLDTLDGSGDVNNPSGIMLDNTKAQLHVIDFQWLGMGRVRFGYFFGGKIHYVHECNNANIRSTVFIRTPNLPMRFEVFNNAIAPAAATFDQICFAILLEGGEGSDGIRRAADTGITGRSFDETVTPVASLRLNAANIRATLADMDLEIFGTASFRWAALLNPTVSDTTPPTWIIPSNSIAEYDISRIGVVTGGELLKSGYSHGVLGSSTTFGSDSLLGLKEDISFYADIDGIPDELVIVAQKLVAGGDTAHASLSWRELI